MRIFISYRRQDGAVAARLIHNELSTRFGRAAVFQDIEDIGWGDNFVSEIEASIASADVVVVVIGPNWPDMIEQRANGDDWVRHEVRAAMARHAQGQARVVPVLVDDAKPLGAALPADIDGLRFLKALSFGIADLQASITRLTEAVQGESFEQRARAENLKRRMAAIAVVLGLAVFFAAWMALFEVAGFDTRLHLLTMRLAQALPGGAMPAASGEVIIVGIDRASVAAVGRRFGPSWRSEIASVVQRTGDAGARMLVMDITLRQSAAPADDAALERALSAVYPRLPVVVAVRSLSAEGGPELLPRLAPWVSWGLACGGRKFGTTYLQALVLRRGDDPKAALWPSLALAAYTGGVALGSAAQLDLLDLSVPVARAGGLGSTVVQGFSADSPSRRTEECSAAGPGDLVLFQIFDANQLPSLGRPGGMLSFADVLRGDAASLKALQGRTVVLGLTSGDDDTHLTGDGERHGVELVAAQIEGLLGQRAIRPVGPLGQAVLMAGLALVGAGLGATLRRQRARWAWPATLALGLVWVLGCVWWYDQEQQLVAWVYGLLALLLGTALARRWTEATT